MYLSDKASFGISMDKITAGNKAKASWIDPRNGRPILAGSYPTEGVESFTTPDELQDALLILRSDRCYENQPTNGAGGKGLYYV